MIKYTPKYGWCLSVFYAPFFPINSPFLALKKINQVHIDNDDDDSDENFRICASGVVL